jgi:hypothetical protein
MTTASADTAVPSLLAVACPRCHAALSVGIDLVRHAARCPRCGKGFLVPEPRVEPAAPAAPRTGLDAVVSDVAPVAAAASHPEMQFSEPVQTIETEEGVVELRRLTPEERAARRARRNLVMLLAGMGILVAIVLIFGRSGKK